MHALLMVTYHLCLQSISTCIVMSRHRQPIQTTAVWPHRCSFELNTSSKSRPGLLQPTLRRSDNVNMHTGIDTKDLSEGIDRFVFNLHAGDRVVSTVFTANKTCLEHCFHNPIR